MIAQRMHVFILIFVIINAEEDPNRTHDECNITKCSLTFIYQVNTQLLVSGAFSHAPVIA